MEGNDSSFKKELVHDADFATRAEARAAIVEYLGAFSALTPSTTEK